MTSERLPFDCVPRWLRRDPDRRVSPRAHLVFMELAAHVDLPDGARPSQQHIADALGCNRDTVRLALNELEEAGVIYREQRYGERGRLPNRYRIIEECVYRPAGVPGESGNPQAGVPGESGNPQAGVPGESGNPQAGVPYASGIPLPQKSGRKENKERETQEPGGSRASPEGQSQVAPLTTSAADATDAPKAEETLVYDDRSGEVRPVGEVADELCGLLADWIESHGAAPPFDRSGRPPRRWRDAVRLMLTKDGRDGEPLDEALPQGSAARSPRRVAAAIEWAQRDDFWCANVLSPVKLRQQYDRLRLQARRRASKPGTAEHQAAQRSRREQWAADLRAQGR